MGKVGQNRGDKLNIVQRCALEVVWALCWLIGALPHAILYYILAPLIKFVIYDTLRYRRGVVDENLKATFPEKSAQELSQISSDFYTTLSEVFVSTIAMSHHDSHKGVIEYVEEEGTSVEQLRGVTWIALTSHFGLWEYYSAWSHMSGQHLIAVYHPLKNKIFDELFKRLREYKKLTPMPAFEMARFIARNGTKYRGESYLLGLIADQNPRHLPDSTWFSFLGRDTIFFEGGEKIARRLGVPVYFPYQSRIARGRYQYRMKLIWDGVESVEPTEITRRYIKLLEEAILDDPSLWLWSHRRWKAKRELQTDIMKRE